MKDKRSVDTAISFDRGDATIEELMDAYASASAAFAAANYTSAPAAYAAYAYAAYASAAYASAAEDAYAAFAYTDQANAMKKEQLISDEEITKLANEYILYNDSKRQWVIEGMKLYREQLKKIR